MGEGCCLRAGGIDSGWGVSFVFGPEVQCG